jgi:hypothetical protein
MPALILAFIAWRKGPGSHRLAQSAKALADSLHAEVKSLKAQLAATEREYQRQIDELVIVVLSLIEQVEQLGGKPNIDRKMLERIASLGRHR